MTESINFTPPQSVVPFLLSDKYISLIVGPVGSLKTTTGIFKIAHEAKKVARSTDGIRRSRYAWIRQTREELRDTTIPDFLKIFPDGVFGRFEKTNYKYTLRFDDVECEVLFRGLDEAEDVRRVLSLQLTGCIFEEFRQANRDVFEAMQGRCGRYPDGTMVKHRPEWGLDHKGNPRQGCVNDQGIPTDKVWGMSNPPDIGTYWEEFLSSPPDNTFVAIQPGGLSPEADWLHFLKSDYYENLAQGKSQAWIDVYINSLFGKSLSGTPVFTSFKRDIHVAKKDLKFNPISANTLIVGMDTGLNPAATYAQIDPRGRLLVFQSQFAEGMGALRFIREVVKPTIGSRYNGARALFVIDPAGMARSQTDEKTVADILRAEGLLVKPASTNSIAARLSAVDSYLTKFIDGDPAILIDAKYNVDLIKAMAGKYKFRIKSNGEAEDTPEKLHPYSDLVDSLQYACLQADGGILFGRRVTTGIREIKQPSIASRAWA